MTTNIDHRPSTWLRYMLCRGSVATVLLVVVIYSTRDGRRQSDWDLDYIQCSKCRKIYYDIIQACFNIRNWFFGMGEQPLRTHGPGVHFYNDVDVPEFASLVGTCALYVFVVMFFIVLFKVGKRDQMRKLMIAIMPPFMAAVMRVSNIQDDDRYNDGFGRNQHISTSHLPGQAPFDACSTHAIRVEEMARTIEYLAKVNNQRERDIAKLSLKNDFLAESLARVYKYNRKIQNQIRNMPPEEESTESIIAEDE